MMQMIPQMPTANDYDMINREGKGDALRPVPSPQAYDQYPPDLPDRERHLSPTDRSLNTILNYRNMFAFARAGAEAMNRGESFWGGTDQHAAQFEALKNYYHQAYEDAPDSVKVMSWLAPGPALKAAGRGLEQGLMPASMQDAARQAQGLPPMPRTPFGFR